MPVTCDSWPSISATCSWSARSLRLCRLANARSFAHEVRVHTAHAILERRLRLEPEPLAHRPIDREKLDELLGVSLMRHRYLDAEHTRHRLNDVVDADRRVGREIDGAAVSGGGRQRQERV